MMACGSEMRWFAVQSHPRREAFAASGVGRLGLDVFLPRMRPERSGRIRRRHGVGPLFPSYFFARFRPAHHLDRVRYSLGVSRVVSAGAQPLPVPDEAISELRERADENGVIVLKAPAFHPGDRVEIQDGPLRGLVGRVEREQNSGRRLMILLECLVHSQVVVEPGCLLPAAQVG
jgi:transcriptional antiterminator RfaH